MPAAGATRLRRRPDWPGAGLCALGLAGPTLGLVRQPGHGWTDPLVAGPIVAGLAVFALFLLWERRGTGDPMLPLGLFGRGNFAWGNVETALVYGGLALLFFVLVVFLQQVAGYTALEAGAATIPTTVVLFLLSQRFGALADRLGPRPFMAGGPLVSAGGVIYLLAMVDESPGFFVDVLPGRRSSRWVSQSSSRRSQPRSSPTPTNTTPASLPVGVPTAVAHAPGVAHVRD